MKRSDREKTVVRRVNVDRMGRGEPDPAQRAKLIFLSLAGAVLLLLVMSFVYTAKARSERNAALAEIEALRQDNARLTQWLEERTQEVEALKKQVQRLQGATKAKPKPAQKKKTATAKKPSRTIRNAR